MAKVNLSDFPILEIDDSNRYESWRSWLINFNLNVEIATMNLGTETITDAQGNDQVVDVFRGRRKLVALIGAVGEKGRRVLDSAGFDFAGAGTYDDALQILTNHYGIEDNIYMRTVRVLHASQAAGESETDYLMRVELLTRKLGIIQNDAERRQFAVAVAVNGLRDPSLRAKLFERPNLTWDNLRDVLRSRIMARNSEAVLESSKSVIIEVKQEVYSVTSSCSKKSTSKSNSKTKSIKCYGCGIRGHEIRYCPDVLCSYCNCRGHTMKDCKKRKKKRAAETEERDSDDSDC